MFFRSFYGSSETGTPPHHDTIPSNPWRPLFWKALLSGCPRQSYNLILAYLKAKDRPEARPVLPQRRSEVELDREVDNAVALLGGGVTKVGIVLRPGRRIEVQNQIVRGSAERPQRMVQEV